MINSNRKGKVGELELAAFLRSHGIKARRGQQYEGGSESADVVSSLSGIHLECKRCERGSIYEWMLQAMEDAGPNQIPVVAHRKNKSQWLAVLSLTDLLNLLIAAGRVVS